MTDWLDVNNLSGDQQIQVIACLTEGAKHRKTCQWPISKPQRPVFNAGYFFAFSASGVMTSHFNDPPYWRDRAEELRVIADGLKEPKARDMVLACARDYELLAERAEERVRMGQDSDILRVHLDPSKNE